MLVLPQMVKVKWHNSTKKWYVDKGYKYTKNGDEFEVYVLDLLEKSRVEVEILCDYCEEMVLKAYNNYTSSLNKSNTKKDCCSNCRHKKTSESRFRYTFETVIAEFNKSNLRILICESDYVDANTVIPYECMICTHKSKTSLTSVLLGRGCQKCKHKINTDKQKHSLEFVEKLFKDNDCTLLTKAYINEDQKLDYLCKCGNKSITQLRTFKKGHVNCEECTKKLKSKKSRKYSIDDVKSIFENEGYELLSTEYTNTQKKLEYICTKGHKNTISLNKFLGGRRCPDCNNEDKKVRYRHEYEYVANIFKEKDCELLSHEYINSSQILDFKCSCGNESTVTLAQFKLGVRCEECEESGKAKTRRDSGRARYTEEYIAWSKSVLIRDNYTCQCCGERGGKLHSHHKDGFHWCIEKRYDIDNGIALCDICHKDFHDSYGRCNNTKEQFDEWIKIKKEKQQNEFIVEEVEDTSSFLFSKEVI